MQGASLPAPGYLSNMTQKIAQFALLVDDYDRAIDYYTTVLGFALVEDTKLTEEKRWVRVQPGPEGSAILLARAVDEVQLAAIGRQGAGRVWLFLHTDQFEQDHARLRAHGVKIINGPRSEPYGQVLVFEDMYGNKWDLIQPARPKDQGRG